MAVTEVPVTTTQAARAETVHLARYKQTVAAAVLVPAVVLLVSAVLEVEVLHGLQEHLTVIVALRIRGRMAETAHITAKMPLVEEVVTDLLALKVVRQDVSPLL
jgi:hypothetical protein